MSIQNIENGISIWSSFTAPVCKFHISRYLSTVFIAVLLIITKPLKPTEKYVVRTLEYCWKKGGKDSQSWKYVCSETSSTYNRKTAPKSSQQWECLSKTSIMTTQVGMLKWLKWLQAGFHMWDIPFISCLDKVTGGLLLLKEGETVPFRYMVQQTVQSQWVALDTHSI